MSQNPLLHTLVEADDCLLVLIDIQDVFLQKCDSEVASQLVDRTGWLMEVAAALSVPMLVTAEDLAVCGSMIAPLTALLPTDTPVYNKMFFGLTGNPDILKAVDDFGRNTIILAGLETDVCVAQSAIGLLNLGYKVAAVTDAVASPGEGQAIGLERMRNAGVLLTSVKALYYEWVRGVEKSGTVAQKINHRFPNPPL